MRSKKWRAVVERFGLRIEICFGPVTDQEAIAWEIEQITKEDTFTTCYSTEEGTNIRCNFTRGGDGASGYKHTESHKTRMKIVLKGRTGHIWTDEERQRASDTRKGVPKRSKENYGKNRKRAVQQLDTQGNVIAEFNSAVQARDVLGISNVLISVHCHNKVPNPLWRFKRV